MVPLNDSLVVLIRDCFVATLKVLVMLLMLNSPVTAHDGGLAELELAILEEAFVLGLQAVPSI